MSLENKFDDLTVAGNADATGETTSPNAAGATNGEFAKQAREHGWVAPTKYDYDAFARTSGTAEDANKPREGLSTVDVPTWASNATRYEWLDEYGDVGPEIPALEAQLYHADTIMKKGMKMEGQVIDHIFDDRVSNTQL